MSHKSCVLLFSGGTDSTCTAALLAEKYDCIHLLTYYEYGTRKSPKPLKSLDKLRNKFPTCTFRHEIIYIDALVKLISYHKYFYYLVRHGFFILSNCGFSSLSWHVRTIVYCMDNNINFVADGLTKELMHFPGHMDFFISEMKNLYSHFGINYENPVREWAIPKDTQLIEQLIINYHSRSQQEDFTDKFTTSKYLYDIGFNSSPNIKGTQYDIENQHECYPFVLFNIFVFWFYLYFKNFESYKKNIQKLFTSKINFARMWLENYKTNKSTNILLTLKKHEKNY